jgi:hypothetical protein
MSGWAVLAATIGGLKDSQSSPPTTALWALNVGCNRKPAFPPLVIF